MGAPGMRTSLKTAGPAHWSRGIIPANHQSESLYPHPPCTFPSGYASGMTHDWTHNWLHGTWQLLRADPSLDFAPGVRMEFRVDGTLCYHVDVGGREQVIQLLYRIEGDLLRTDNPAAPHSMSVRIAHGSGDTLLLDFGGPQAILIREL